MGSCGNLVNSLSALNLDKKFTCRGCVLRLPAFLPCTPPKRGYVDLQRVGLIQRHITQPTSLPSPLRSGLSPPGFPQTSPYKRVCLDPRDPGRHTLLRAARAARVRVRGVYRCSGICHLDIFEGEHERERVGVLGFSYLWFICFATRDLHNVKTVSSIRSTALHRSQNVRSILRPLSSHRYVRSNPVAFVSYVTNPPLPSRYDVQKCIGQISQVTSAL